MEENAIAFNIFLNVFCPPPSMELSKLAKKIPSNIYAHLEKRFTQLRPAQAKAIKQGLFRNKNLLICTPTASGKTLVAEMAILNAVHNQQEKAVYVVPLRALANEKYREFKERFPFKVGLSSGDLDASDKHLNDCQLVITTSEKLDSLIRHHAPWIRDLGAVVIDEIHLLNDPSRGPTLEIILTLLRGLLSQLQVVALSATIGNPAELADWLHAELVQDSWRPVRLDQGVHQDGEIEFFST